MSGLFCILHTKNVIFTNFLKITLKNAPSICHYLMLKQNKVQQNEDWHWKSRNRNGINWLDNQVKITKTCRSNRGGLPLVYKTKLNCEILLTCVAPLFYSFVAIYFSSPSLPFLFPSLFSHSSSIVIIILTSEKIVFLVQII